MKYGFIDCDLIDKGTKHPNLALMKLAGFYRDNGIEVKLLEGYDEVDKVFCSKVFTKTNDPDFLSEFKCEIQKGGTGYNLQHAEPLPYEIEHHKPYYDIYKEYWMKRKGEKGWSTKVKDYFDYSIGFTTRGCIRQCPFCVNRYKTKVEKWSPVEEFIDLQRLKIALWDDNILAYPKWKDIFDELNSWGRPFRFRQGMDVRLMTKEKALVLEHSRYERELVFAFDNIADYEQIERGFNLLRSECSRETRAYVLVGFYNSGINELKDTLDRILLLRKYDVVPFIMKHENYLNNEYASIIVEIGRFCNKPAFLKKMTFYDYVKKYGSKKSKEIIEVLDFKELLNLTYNKGV